MKKINYITVFFNLIFLLIYIFPIKAVVELCGLELEKYIFLVLCMIIYLMYLIDYRKILLEDILFSILIVLISFIKKSLEPIMLIEYLLLYRILKTNRSDVKVSKYVLIISTLGVFFYSFLYLGDLKGYMSTGIGEINQSGFLIFFLFLNIYNENRKIGIFLLILGLITLSRNYMLCFVMFMLMRNLDFERIYSFLTFKKMIVFSLIFLTGLSFSFSYAYDHGKISESYNDLRKYVYIYDYSNYFRFSTNYNLIEIYIENPSRLLTGIEDREFILLCKRLALKKGRVYRAIYPHNYFFSYFRIFGLFCIFIFMYLEKIVKLVLNQKNYVLLLVLFVYVNILGLGFTNYYLYLTMFTLLNYRRGEEQNEK